MSETPAGKILYKLKTQYSDGTTHILFDPLELVQKVVALIPPPRANLLRYHGLLAPNSKMRSKIIPQQNEEKREKKENPEHGKWADLLKRSFVIDILKCAQCGGKMRVISTIQDPAIAKRILESIGIPYEPPRKAPPRAPPRQEFHVNPPDEFSQISPETDSFE